MQGGDNILRNARFDLIYSEINGQYSELPTVFLRVANEYFRAFVEKKGTVVGVPAAQRLYEEWDRQTMKNFYYLLNTTMGARAKGTWVPYEMAVFNELYQNKKIV